MSENNGRFCKLENLQPGMEERFHIQGVVIGKGVLGESRTHHGVEVFSFLFGDGRTTIKVIAFRDVARRVSQMVNFKTWFSICDDSSSIRPANKMFNSTNHPSEITLSDDSELVEHYKIHKNFPSYLPVTNLSQLYPDDLVNVFCVITDVSEIEEIYRGMDLFLKRTVMLIDRSERKIPLIIWNETAENFDLTTPRVAKFAGLFVKEYEDELTLRLNAASIINIPVKKEKRKELMGWYRWRYC